MNEKERNKTERRHSVYYYGNKVNGVIWTGNVARRETMRKTQFFSSPGVKERENPCNTGLGNRVKLGVVL
jgi:hypothetical protein